MLGGDMRLPSGSTDVGDTAWIGEKIFNLLERLAGCLREHEEDVDKHGNTEYAEDDVCLWRTPSVSEERLKLDIGFP